MQLYLWEAVILTLALSLDTFTAGVTLGTQEIRIPFRSLFALSTTCSVSLLISMILGDFVGEWISPHTARLVGCCVLTFMGCVRLFDSLLKKLLRRCCNSNGIVFRFKNLKIFLQVCVDSAQADFNDSKSISVPEAVSLAAALSLDGLTAGFGAGMLQNRVGLIFLLSLLVNLLAAKGGCCIGKRFSERFQNNISWSAGVLLILLGVMKLF